MNETNNLIRLILNDELRKEKELNLVPSENRISKIATIPYILDIYNRYFFNETNDINEWEFRGAKGIGWMEKEIVNILSDLLHSQYNDVRALSGLHVMTIVFAAFVNESSVYILSPELGGHYATYNLCSKFTKNIKYIPFSKDGEIDFNLLEDEIIKNNPGLIYIDQCNGIFLHDISSISKIIKKHSLETILHVDVSHWLGLILGDAVENPLEIGASSISSSTHKTFPGPQKGIFATNKEDIFNKFINSRFYMVSNHHFASVLSLGISLIEFKKWGKEYAHDTINNSRYLAKLLNEYGFEVVSKDGEFTDTHQIWFSSNKLGLESYKLCNKLSKMDINVNFQKYMPFYNDGLIRIGVNEITRQGATLKSIEFLAEIIYLVSSDKENNKIEECHKLLINSFEKDKYKSECEVEFEDMLNSFIRKMRNYYVF